MFEYVCFPQLKGFPEELVSGEVDKILSDVDLVDKRNNLVSTLSGGMKRKLSVGIALAGGSKVRNAILHLRDLINDREFPPQGPTPYRCHQSDRGCDFAVISLCINTF